ncbi:MAG TPA: hypothetical protein VLV86_02515 [Vicinamibacterales bacterium]|nr:hypothetical protein [Vicinamibacterales bacterium]
MKISVAHAYIPAANSLAVKIGQDPAVDLVAGVDLKTPLGSGSSRLDTNGGGQAFVPVTSGPALAAARDNVIGKRLAFANASFTMVDQGLPLTGLALPAGTHTVFEVVGVVISGADTYHAFTREDASRWDQALSVANTVSSLTDLLAPLVPALQHYQPALKGVELVLKVVRSGNEEMKAENDYRVVQMKVGA